MGFEVKVTQKVVGVHVCAGDHDDDLIRDYFCFWIAVDAQVVAGWFFTSWELVLLVIKRCSEAEFQMTRVHFALQIF